MKAKKNKSIWDEKRFIQEYVKMGELISSTANQPFERLNWADQIRVKKLTVALWALFGIKNEKEEPHRLIHSIFGDYVFYRPLFENSTLSEDNKARLMALLKEAINDDKTIKYLTHMDRHYDEGDDKTDDQPIDPWNSITNQRQLFYMLMGFRLATEKLLEYFSGMMEASIGGIFGYHAIRELYFADIEEKNDKIEEMMAILLSGKIKKSFTEEELKKDYGFPHETEDELTDWELDNY